MKWTAEQQRQFVEAHIHELFGVVCDAAITRAQSAELSQRLAQFRGKIESELRHIFEEFYPSNRTVPEQPTHSPKPPPPPPANNPMKPTGR